MPCCNVHVRFISISAINAQAAHKIPCRMMNITPLVRQSIANAIRVRIVWAVILRAVHLLSTLPRQSDGRPLANFVAAARRHTPTRARTNILAHSHYDSYVASLYSVDIYRRRHKRPVCAEHFRYKNYSARPYNYLVGDRITIDRNHVRLVPHITQYTFINS